MDFAIPSPSALETRWLGRISFASALQLQETLVEERREGKIEDTLLLLEHEPVYTIGRTADQSSLQSAHLTSIPVVQTNRGGQATYHGPGQLVGYLILDLNRMGRDLHRYLRALEKGLIESCAQAGITAERRDGLTGVWVGPKKLASIGVGVRKWVTMHGFAINVSADLTGFDCINPCGLGVAMTSISRELNRTVELTEFATLAVPCLGNAIAELLS